MTMEKGFKIPVLDHGHVIYVDHMGSDSSICSAARVSYNKAGVIKTPEDDQKLINRLYRDKHTSPFEMAKVVMNIKMPIFIARQYIRHRMQNVNEVSARYTELPEEFYLPEKWRAQDTKNKQSSTILSEWDEPRMLAGKLGHSYSGTLHDQFSEDLAAHCDESYKLYKSLLNSGVAREMARMVLPLNIYTEMRVCWDLKNLLHFVTLREDSHAQAEIQDYGRAIKSMMTDLFPMVMNAYEQYKFVMVEQPRTSPK